MLRYLFHEMRVPLNSIVLAVEDLRYSLSATGQSFDPQSSTNPASPGNITAGDMLDIVADSGNAMTRLLNDYLTMETVEAGKMQLEVRGDVI